MRRKGQRVIHRNRGERGGVILYTFSLEDSIIRPTSDFPSTFFQSSSTFPCCSLLVRKLAFESMDGWMGVGGGGNWGLYRR